MSLATFLLKKKQGFCDLASCILCPRPDKHPSICRQIVISDFLADSLAINEIKELQCFSVSINFPLGKIGINHWLFSQARQYIFFPCVINKGEKIQSTVLSPKDNSPNFYTLGKKHHSKTWSPNSQVQWVLSLGGKIKFFPLVEGWA